MKPNLNDETGVERIWKHSVRPYIAERPASANPTASTISTSTGCAGQRLTPPSFPRKREPIPVVPTPSQMTRARFRMAVMIKAPA